MKRRQFIAGLGSALGWPVVAQAQQPAVPVIGFLNPRSAGDAAHLAVAFLQGLNTQGFVEGRNVVIEYRWADGQYDRLRAMAADLAHHRVTVIAATGGIPSALAAKEATSTIPIVFSMDGDPVALGLVASRPAGNITGASVYVAGLESKRLAMLHELVPKAQTVALLVNPNNPIAGDQAKDVQVAAETLGLKIMVLKVNTESELEAGFSTIVEQGAQALIVAVDPFFNSRRNILVWLAARYAIPAIYDHRDTITAGGLMSYGTNFADAYRQAGVYTGRVLKGAKPADLPVDQVSKYELLINLKTAKALDLTVPETLLATADEVIQ